MQLTAPLRKNACSVSLHCVYISQSLPDWLMRKTHVCSHVCLYMRFVLWCCACDLCGFAWGVACLRLLVCFLPSSLSSLHFTITTISTVGYGDYAPITVPGKFLVVIMIVFSLVVVGDKINELLTLLNNSSPYSRARYTVKKSTCHIVITGRLTFTAVDAFLKEFYHPDHGDMKQVAAVIGSVSIDCGRVLNNHYTTTTVHYTCNMKQVMAVLLSPELPSLELVNLIESKYVANVTYIQVKCSLSLVNGRFWVTVSCSACAACNGRVCSSSRVPVPRALPCRHATCGGPWRRRARWSSFSPTRTPLTPYARTK